MDDLRRLLVELRAAEEDRQHLARDSAEYARATTQVDRISREVWEAVQADRARTRIGGVSLAVDTEAPVSGDAAGAVEAAFDGAERQAHGGI